MGGSETETTLQSVGLVAQGALPIVNRGGAHLHAQVIGDVEVR